MVAGLDLAKTHDYSAVAIGFTREEESNRILRVRGAKIYQHQPYTALEVDIAKLVNEFCVLKLVVDATNEKAFAERLQNIGLPVEPIHFTAPLKHDMISYVLMLAGSRRIQIPRVGPFMPELQRQLKEQERLITTATIRYDHPADRHDDLLWAFCLMCYGAKPWLEGQVDYGRIYPL